MSTTTTRTPLAEYRSGTGKVLRPGDPAKVTGLRGDFKVTDIRQLSSGTIEVTVYGGTAGRARFRVVTVDRVRRKRATA